MVSLNALKCVPSFIQIFPEVISDRLWMGEATVDYENMINVNSKRKVQQCSLRALRYRLLGTKDTPFEQHFEKIQKTKLINIFNSILVDSIFK